MKWTFKAAINELNNVVLKVEYLSERNRKKAGIIQTREGKDEG